MWREIEGTKAGEIPAFSSCGPRMIRKKRGRVAREREEKSGVVCVWERSGAGGGERWGFVVRTWAPRLRGGAGEDPALSAPVGPEGRVNETAGTAGFLWPRERLPPASPLHSTYGLAPGLHVRCPGGLPSLLRVSLG